MAITGLHTLLYSSEVDAFRVAMRDVFEFPHVAFDNGFMIFDCPPATMEPHPGPPDFDVHSTDRVTHEVGFVCDEIEATVAELRAKGIEFRGEPKDEGWGKVISSDDAADGGIIFYGAYKAPPRRDGSV
ncbi:MAG TPA: VOC family protein [Candidatus Handelsmanbacteria bacterium]|nr:VOC family protein [Candidatus Handelsmanbacteria bacterium]